MKSFILATYIRINSFLDIFRVKLPINDCCYRISEKVSNKLDKYYNDIIQDIRVANEENTRKLLTRLHAEHTLEKQEIVKEFEEKIKELQKVVDEKEELIKKNQKAYSYIAEIIPKMQMLSEQNAMMVEIEKMRWVEKKQKYDRVADGWNALNEMLKNKTEYFKKMMGLK